MRSKPGSQGCRRRCRPGRRRRGVGREPEDDLRTVKPWETRRAHRRAKPSGQDTRSLICIHQVSANQWKGVPSACSKNDPGRDTDRAVTVQRIALVGTGPSTRTRRAGREDLHRRCRSTPCAPAGTGSGCRQAHAPGRASVPEGRHAQARPSARSSRPHADLAPRVLPRFRGRERPLHGTVNRAGQPLNATEDAAMSDDLPAGGCQKDAPAATRGPGRSGAGVRPIALAADPHGPLIHAGAATDPARPRGSGAVFLQDEPVVHPAAIAEVEVVLRTAQAGELAEGPAEVTRDADASSASLRSCRGRAHAGRWVGCLPPGPPA